MKLFQKNFFGDDNNDKSDTIKIIEKVMINQNRKGGKLKLKL